MSPIRGLFKLFKLTELYKWTAHVCKTTHTMVRQKDADVAAISVRILKYLKSSIFGQHFCHVTRLHLKGNIRQSSHSTRLYFSPHGLARRGDLFNTQGLIALG